MDNVAQEWFWDLVDLDFVGQVAVARWVLVQEAPYVVDWQAFVVRDWDMLDVLAFDDYNKEKWDSNRLNKLTLFDSTDQVL